MDTNSSIRLSSTSCLEFLKSIHSISANLRGFLLKQDQKSIHQHRTKRRRTDDQQPNPSSKTVTLTRNNINQQQQASPIHPVTSLTNGYTFKLGTRNSRNSSRTSFNLIQPQLTGNPSTSTDKPRIYNGKQAAESTSFPSNLHQDSDEQEDQHSQVQSESESDADSEYQSSSPPKAKPKPRPRRKPSTTSTINASDEPTTRCKVENQKLMDLSQGLEEVKGKLEAVWTEMLDSCKEVRQSKVANSNSKSRNQGRLDHVVDDDESERFRFRLPTLMEASCRNLSVHLDLHCQSSSINISETSINHDHDHYFKQMGTIYETLPELGISNLVIVHAFDFMIRHLDEIHQEFKVRAETFDHSKGKSKGDDEKEVDEWKPDHQGAALETVARFIRDASRMVFKKVVELEWDFEANHVQKRLITTELEKISDFQTKPTQLKQIRNIDFGDHFSSYQGNGTASMDYLSKTDFNSFDFGSHDRVKSFLNFHAFHFILDTFKTTIDRNQGLLDEQFNQVKLLSCLIDAKIYWFKLYQAKLGGKRSIYSRIYGGPEESNAEHPNSIHMIKNYEPEKMISSFLQLLFAWISNKGTTKDSFSIQREKVELVKKQLMRWMIELFELSLESSEMVFRDGIVVVEEEESRSIKDQKRLRNSSKLAQSILIKVTFELVSLLDGHPNSLSRDSKAILEEISFCFSIYCLYSLEMERLSDDTFQSSKSGLDVKELLENGNLPNRSPDEKRSNHQEQVQELVSLISRFKDESEAFSRTQRVSESSFRRKILAEEKAKSEEEIESVSSSSDPLDSESIPSSPSSTATSSSSPDSLNHLRAAPSISQPATFITTIQNLLSTLEDSSTFQIGNEESRKGKILSISSSNSLSLFLLSLVLKNLSETQEETTRSEIKIASNLSILESEALKLSLETEERRHSRNPFLTSQWDFYVKREQFDQMEESSGRTQRRREWDDEVGDMLYEHNEKSRFIREKLDLWLKRSEGRSIELRSKAHRNEVEFDGKRDKKSVRLDQSNELERGDDEEEGEKWRYEELVDAWVLKTPNDVVGNPNVKKQKRKRGQSSKNPVSKTRQARMANREEEQNFDFITPKRPLRSNSRIARVNQKVKVSDAAGSSGSIEESDEDEEEIESDHSGPVLDDESMKSSSPIQVDHSSPAPPRPSKPAFQIISNEEELSLSQSGDGNEEEADDEEQAQEEDEDDDDELNLFNQDTPAPARVRKPPTRFGNLTFSGKGWNKSGSDLVLDEASSALTSSRNGSPFTFDASTQSGKRSTSSMTKRSRSSLPSFGSNDLDFFNPSLKSRASSSSLRSESQKGNARESISMLLEKQERVKVMERMRRDEDAKLQQAERGFRERKKSRRN